MPYQSPISPGRSWYEDTAGPRPEYPGLDGDRTCDVVIIGGGFTGLSAAAHLAKAGTNVVLIDAYRFGDGASGRNGGQLGTGQRAWAEDLESEYGLARAKALFDLAEEAKAHLLEFTAANQIDIDYMPGQLSVAHKPRYVDDYKAHAEIMASRFAYPHISFMDARETAERLGSTAYFGGTRDTGTGHIHPMKLVIGTARVAALAGAQLFEGTPSTGIMSSGGKVKVSTPRGTVMAQKCLIAVNAYGGTLEPVSAAHIMPIGSFIGATVPLGAHSNVLPGGEAVDDSRFVVRYFRRSKDGRLLFGGREVYGVNDPWDIHIHIRRQIAELYPALGDVEITHGWGGYVGITVPRKPFVREVMPNVISAGGYSGHGVMLSNYFGKLYAETVAGNRDRLKLIEDLKIPPFPGGRRFRTPLLFLALNWFALRDRI
ncbi:FAD-binding oxidoreductase [Mesorhizobium sp. M7A.F.Ca.CA.001.07.2.1]|uniref:NAD(P)/FAD-dependent oxidoreductase n=3 Tax=Phyllobacteriaceae TaxID=69277 RepID=UPI000FCA32E9|nr:MULTISPECIES: FAD-binding oxidoreductase [Mesorhizobium]MCF6126840.1 FAD-binding oxidoreductase [Mesorhizobium ciceri]MCQ8818065.1 FAD-binding oxidoreductase [Mesorhizobium sp. SEMIA396]RUX69278.1 FAD-binding oxidoreductase [Mesorhizobium sp. M7A.F.Ca.CA.004.08.2.1]RUX80150.1 FAD-binding oxidoreductase [Mesorhizobium sp. M7A.F.Ca.CA.004.08.1.1]RUY06472.1 FAD-binding oxidoreductase [Mesorhizobium sp. M7A.F.Ca.CA.004.04.1.1]